MKASALLSLCLLLTSCAPLKAVLSTTTAPTLELSALQREPITTSFSDADKTRVLADNFGNDQVFRPLEVMPPSDSGGYLLTPGFYEMTAQSYCLKAGTHGPSAGDGYLFAPLAGPQANIVQALVQRRVEHPDISQSSLQTLLWAIIAKAKFSNLPDDLKVVAARLLSPQELVQLNGGAINLIPDSILDPLIATLPAPVKAVLRAENQMRGMLYSGNASFSELESQAILAGMAPISNPEYKRGRWSKHQDGFFVRYYPQGYQQTRVQVYVPGPEENSTSSPIATTIDFDASDDVAVPANTGAQRLMQSNQPVPAQPGACPAGLTAAPGDSTTRLPIEEGSWDRKCRALAVCLARSFEGITKVEGLRSHCSGTGRFASLSEAFVKTKGQCAAHPNGTDTGQPVVEDNQNGFYLYLRGLNAQPQPGLPDQNQTGQRILDWTLGAKDSTRITEVAWNERRYAALQNWTEQVAPPTIARDDRIRFYCRKQAHQP